MFFRTHFHSRFWLARFYWPQSRSSSNTLPSTKRDPKKEQSRTSLRPLQAQETPDGTGNSLACQLFLWRGPQAGPWCGISNPVKAHFAWSGPIHNAPRGHVAGAGATRTPLVSFGNTFLFSCTSGGQGSQPLNCKSNGRSSVPRVAPPPVKQ